MGDLSCLFLKAFLNTVGKNIMQKWQIFDYNKVQKFFKIVKIYIEGSRLKSAWSKVLEFKPLFLMMHSLEIFQCPFRSWLEKLIKFCSR